MAIKTPKAIGGKIDSNNSLNDIFFNFLLLKIYFIYFMISSWIKTVNKKNSLCLRGCVILFMANSP